VQHKQPYHVGHQTIEDGAFGARTRFDEGKDKPKNVSRFEGLKPKKTNFYCRRCEVSLCEACFRPWHDEKELPPTPLQD
jgi:hypothetical protein